MYLLSTLSPFCKIITEMGEEVKSLYIKRTQRDYLLSFKLAVVREAES